MTTLWSGSGALATIFQNGLVEAQLRAPLAPALQWNMLVAPEPFPLKIGETLLKTRDGLITPSARATVTLTPGTDPPTVSRSREQFSLSVEKQGASMDSYLPNATLAAANTFLADVERLAMHGVHSINRIRRDVFLAAYGGGSSFATAAGAASTSLVVADATGFDTVVVNGASVAVSATNPGTLSIAGGAGVTYTAVNLGTNTITLSSAQTWSQYDSVVRSDATPIFRQNSRATDRLLVAGDTATIATFRSAAMWLRGQNVPGVDGLGGDYACFINTDIEDALMADAEFRNAVNGAGLARQLADGALGRYAGIQFFRVAKSESRQIANLAPYQTTIHRSLLVGGGGAVIEGYVDPMSLVLPAGEVANMGHFRRSIQTGMALVARQPQDALGEMVRLSWTSAYGWCAPTDINNGTGSDVRFKRGVVIHTSGPA
jgi:hypothetical protein